jgi:hypothetical protein
LLVIIAERWKVAAPCCDIFEILASRTIQMMDNRARGQNDPSITTEGQMSGDNEDLMQWVTNITDAGMSEDLNGLLASLLGDLRSDVPEL